MLFSTPDLCDQYDTLLQVIPPALKHFGGQTAFFGEIVTAKCFEDNSTVKSTLAEPGTGRVLVVDGGGSMRCALLGDQIATCAVENRWAGIIIYGCVRDVTILSTLPIGIMALAAHPRKSIRRGEGQKQLNINFAGASIQPGNYVYADENGAVVSAEKLPLTEKTSLAEKAPLDSR
ncbi:ribonuclease E activity regulator RraA [Zooshikella ganghwensis]|uniref:4-hydroxy-4-methyl-2-oxoglutarate aldolase n=1 Tax=Zooshikella ganghwensis TaxID=202772 RepID=A0A4P9VNF5_9GAMM|nr:ribonuclease E activity regulator RraA [Zooshikella ganghwensis]RDH44169.1 putative 4-hydroxy-4-methyl-2-oxoglutarate aldolase [Zooshikella ganghwensis]